MLFFCLVVSVAKLEVAVSTTKRELQASVTDKQKTLSKLREVLAKQKELAEVSRETENGKQELAAALRKLQATSTGRGRNASAGFRST